MIKEKAFFSNPFKKQPEPKELVSGLSFSRSPSRRLGARPEHLRHARCLQTYSENRRRRRS